MLDSGAFSRISTGVGHMPVQKYACQIRRWAECGQLVAAVAQDYMCEPFVLRVTGQTVAEHQARTIARYRELREHDTPTYIMPVLQGFSPDEYRRHIAAYGAILNEGAWVGVGSVCKRNGSPQQVEAVLSAIASERPDLRLHGFGLKRTALTSHCVNELLHSCDSMAWSYAARMNGRNGNDHREALAYAASIARTPIQLGMFTRH